MNRNFAERLSVPLEQYGKNQFLVRANYAYDVLDHCATENVTILGIEAFRLLDSCLRPEMDLIADFSSIYELSVQERSEKSISLARLFIHRVAKDPDLLFEFQFAED